MASAYSTPHTYKEYVPQLPLGAIQKGLEYKQQKYDANREKLQNYLNVFSNTDIAKVEDQEHFYNNLKLLKGNIDKMGMGDLSMDGAAEQIAQYIGYAADDDVIRGIAGTKVLRKIQTEGAEAKKRNDGSYSDLNYAYSMEGITNWLNDGQVGSNYQPFTQGRTGYIPYTDVMEKSMAALDKLNPNISMVERKDGSGFYFIDEEHKVISDQRIVNTLENVVFQDPNVRQQMGINSWGSYERQPVEALAEQGRGLYENKVKGFEESVRQLKQLQSTDPTRKDEYQEQIDLFTAEIKKKNDAINSPDWNKYVEENKSQVAQELYKDNLYNGMFSMYRQHDITYKRTADAVAVAQYEDSLSKKRDDKKILGGILEMLDNGQFELAQRTAMLYELTPEMNQLIELNRDIISDPAGSSDPEGATTEFFRNAMGDLEYSLNSSTATINSDYSVQLNGADISNKSNAEIIDLINTSSDQQFKNALIKYQESKTQLKSLQETYKAAEDEYRNAFDVGLIEAQGEEFKIGDAGLTVEYDEKTDQYIMTDKYTKAEERGDWLERAGHRFYIGGNAVRQFANSITGRGGRADKFKQNKKRHQQLLKIAKEAKKEYTGLRVPFGARMTAGGVVAAGSFFLTGGASASVIAGASTTGGLGISGVRGKPLEYLANGATTEGSSFDDVFNMHKELNRAEFDRALSQYLVKGGVDVSFKRVDLTNQSNRDLAEDVYRAIPNIEKIKLPANVNTVEALFESLKDPEVSTTLELLDMGSGGLYLKFGEGRKDMIPLDLGAISPYSRLSKLNAKVTADRREQLLLSTSDLGFHRANVKTASKVRENAIKKARNADQAEEAKTMTIPVDNPVSKPSPYGQITFSDNSKISFNPSIIYRTVQSYDKQNKSYIEDNSIYPQISYSIIKPDGTKMPIVNKKYVENIKTDSRDTVMEIKNLIDSIIANILANNQSLEITNVSNATE